MKAQSQTAVKHYWLYNRVGGNIGARWATSPQQAIDNYNAEKGETVAVTALERAPYSEEDGR